MKHLGHTYGGFIPAISERGMTLSLREAVLVEVQSQGLNHWDNPEGLMEFVEL
jgi:hypothetical protein